MFYVVEKFDVRHGRVVLACVQCDGGNSSRLVPPPTRCVPNPTCSCSRPAVNTLQAQCLTLPDFYGKAWGPAVEVVVSLLTCISFVSLLAGNLVSALFTFLLL